MDLETFPIDQMSTPSSLDQEIIELPLVDDPTPQQILDEERKELEEEWIKICKKEYSLFETVRQKEETSRAQKLKLRSLIKDRYQAELATHTETVPVTISIDSESHFYIRQ